MVPAVNKWKSINTIKALPWSWKNLWYWDSLRASLYNVNLWLTEKDLICSLDVLYSRTASQASLQQCLVAIFFRFLLLNRSFLSWPRLLRVSCCFASCMLRWHWFHLCSFSCSHPSKLVPTAVSKSNTSASLWNNHSFWNNVFASEIYFSLFLLCLSFFDVCGQNLTVAKTLLVFVINVTPWKYSSSSCFLGSHIWMDFMQI